MTSKLFQKIRASLPAGRRGFTLIETLVAVLILVTAIAGPLTIASKGLQSALVAKDQTIADYLAQDAVEYVRFARDTNGLNGQDWLVGPGSGPTDLEPCKNSNGCYFDSLSQSPQNPTQCSSPMCADHVLKYNTDAAVQQYTYGTGDTIVPTPFTRTVKLVALGSTNTEVSLEVTVSWSDLPGLTHNVVVRENLLNWQKTTP